MKKSSDIRIRTVPSNANPTPRPSTSTKDGRVPRSENNLTQNYKDDNDALNMYNFVINEEYLLKTCNVVDFLNLQEITLVVDTSIQSVLEIGDLLPNLRSLNLDHSKIASIRDLGVGLRKLTTLSLNDCTLTELDGMGSLTDLSILYLNYNYIYDVTPLAMLENLKEVSLKGNRIADLSFADALSSCPCITKLQLAGNPIAKALPNYREVVASLIPSLQTLDNTVISMSDRSNVSHGMVLEAASALTLAREELDDELRMEMLIMNEDVKLASTSIKSSTFSHSTDTSGIQLLPDTGSELTHGNSVALVGGMAAALRRRRTTEKGVDEASALELLDNALSSASTTSKTNDNGSNGGADQPHLLSSSFCEGDVTAQLSNIAQDPSPGYLAMTERVKTAAAKRATTSHGIALSNSKPRNNSLISNNNAVATSLDIPRPRTSASSVTPMKSSTIGGNSSGSNSSSSWLTRPRTSGDFSALRKEDASRVSFTSLVGSSRPLSASEFSSDGSQSAAPSAPFKISLSATDKKSPQENRLRQLKDTVNDEDDDFPAHHRYRYHKPRNKEELKFNYDSEEDDADLSNDNMNDRDDEEEEEEKEGNSDQEDLQMLRNKNTGGTSQRHRKSIIHMDIVRRVQDGSKKRDGTTFDSEAIGIQHADRHLAMTTSGRMVRSPQPQEEIESSQPGLLKGLAAVSTVGKALREGHSGERVTTSQRIRKEEGQDEDSGGGNSFTSSAKAGKSLGFDLRGSLEAIDQWVDDMDSQSESDDIDKLSSGHIVQSHRSGSRKKILSRDTIMSMCVGEIEDNEEDRSETECIISHPSRQKISTKRDTKGMPSNSNPHNNPNHTTSTASCKPDILVISHDRSYDELDADDMVIPLSPTPSSPPPPPQQHQQPAVAAAAAQNMSMSNRKLSFRSKGLVTTTATTSTINTTTHRSKGKNSRKSDSSHRNSKQVMVFGKRQDNKQYEEEASDAGDGYGDLDDILMTDFDMEGLDSPTVRIQDRERIEKENRSRRKITDTLPNEGIGNSNSNSNGNGHDGHVNNTLTSRKNAFVGQQVLHDVSVLGLHPNYSGSVGSRHKIRAGVVAKPVKLLALNKTISVHKPTMTSSSSSHDISAPTPSSSSSTNTSSILATPTVNTQSVKEKKSSKSSRSSKANSMRGGSLLLTDEELIQLLNLPPKTTPALRTKSSFQEFFCGMSRQRMIMLLEKAYIDVEESSRDARIQKRLELLDDVLVI